MSKPKCEDCIFAAYYKSYDKLWQCRYYPPMPNVPDNDWNRDSWRVVKNDFWCSKYQSKTSDFKGVVLETGEIGILSEDDS